MGAGRVEGAVFYRPHALFLSTLCESTDYENKNHVLYLNKDDKEQ